MDDFRIAWIVPSVELGAYWQPVLREFTKVYEQTIFYTGAIWPGFDPTSPGASAFKLVGETKSIELMSVAQGYGRGFMYASPSIVGHLLRFKPHLIFASAFSIWTVLALLLKPLAGWRIAIIYDGSSPNTDFRDSGFRSFARRVIARFTDAFIANSKAGKAYLRETLGVEEEKIFNRIYLVPDAKALLQGLEKIQPIDLKLLRPIFLYVGRLTPRKGLKPLLEACALLKNQGYCDYTLLIVGDGEQREELEIFVKNRDLSEQVTWAGWVEYGRLGAYFRQADVFVFPTYEDVWGMVVPEALVLGKPILCSKGAAAAELLVEGENGYIFDPNNPEELAESMRRFIDTPDLIASMGRKSELLIAQCTPQTAAHSFFEVISFVLKKQ